jgi:hypothetical protein
MRSRRLRSALRTTLRFRFPRKTFRFPSPKRASVALGCPRVMVEDAWAACGSRRVPAERRKPDDRDVGRCAGHKIASDEMPSDRLSWAPCPNDARNREVAIRARCSPSLPVENQTAHRQIKRTLRRAAISASVSSRSEHVRHSFLSNVRLVGYCGGWRGCCHVRVRRR